MWCLPFSKYWCSTVSNFIFLVWFLGGLLLVFLFWLALVLDRLFFLNPKDITQAEFARRRSPGQCAWLVVFTERTSQFFYSVLALLFWFFWVLTLGVCFVSVTLALSSYGFTVKRGLWILTERLILIGFGTRPCTPIIYLPLLHIWVFLHLIFFGHTIIDIITSQFLLLLFNFYGWIPLKIPFTDTLEEHFEDVRGPNKAWYSI